ncbi:MAG TPA: HlyD family efflux transporter periplasmic adaptor subunit [Thermoanaerobaculia bacterium]|jgi:multidrug resistance efflux pump|nr:HlyD family efflux transporter periplasmic adaptor subunit [Thermoanaerobaculia bacterium]
MTRAFVSALLLLPLAACYSGYSETAPERDLRVRRGDFTSDVVISGELEAARGELLSVPPLPSWQTAIKWIAEDGAAVKAGDPVAELDNSALTSDLDSKRQSAMQATQELQQRESEWEADVEQKELEVEQKKSALDKAILDAKVPRDLLSGRKFEENQNALRRTTTEHEKAVDSLRARRTAVRAERENLVLNIAKTQRAIAIAEGAINALVLRAPKDGIVVVKDHQWEGRKLQSGDPVWVGFPIALLPELSTIRVNAALADVDDGKIAAGMPATVTLDGYPDMQFTGKIASISAVAQESRRQSLRRHFEVLVALDRLDPSRMRPGLSARVVVRREARPSQLLAPRAAIDFTGNAPRVRLESGEMKDVKIGACNAQDCVVAGLDEGTRLAPIVEVKRG